MKKTYLLIVLALVFVLALSACGCKHETWNDADCVTPKTCAECGETEGEALGHSWNEATCELPKTCATCALTEGEALGHSWQDATCENAKTCATCAATEGEALGHDWQDATTELPKTCATCAATEGEKIVTDPRFTTAATAAVQGKWMCEVPMSAEALGIPGFEGDLKMQVIMDLGNDGTFGISFDVTDKEAFNSAMIDYLAESLYAEFKNEGMNKEEADQAMKLAYGMDVKTYAAAAMSSMSASEILGMADIKMVYYIEGDELFLGISWTEEMSPAKYVLEGDTLTLHEDIAGTGEDKTVFTRMAE